MQCFFFIPHCLSHCSNCSQAMTNLTESWQLPHVCESETWTIIHITKRRSQRAGCSVFKHLLRRLGDYQYYWWPAFRASTPGTLHGLHTLDWNSHTLDWNTYTLDGNTYTLDWNIHTLDWNTYTLDWEHIHPRLGHIHPRLGHIHTRLEHIHPRLELTHPRL